MTGLGRGAALAVVATALEKLVTLGIALWLPRYLGLADYGHYTLVIALLGFFQGLPDASLETVLVARLASAGAPVAELAGKGAALRLLTSAAGALVGLLAIVLAAGEPALALPSAVWALGLLCTAAAPWRALLRAELRLGRYLVLLAVQGAVAILVLLAAVRFGGGLAAVLAAGPAASGAGLLVGRLLAGRRAPLAFDADVAGALGVAAWPLVATALAVVGAQQLLQVVLLRSHGAEELGLLGGAQRLTDAINLLPQALGVSLLPALARGHRGARNPAREAARALAVALVPLLATFAVWPEQVLTLVLGPPFAPAAQVLRGLALVALLNATGSVVTTTLVAAGLQRLLLVSTIGAAGLSAVLGALVVPRFGAFGVVVATAIGMMSGQTVLALLSSTGALVRPVLAGASRPLGVGALVGAAVAGLGLALLPGGALLAAGYVLAIALTRTVTWADVTRWST